MPPMNPNLRIEFEFSQDEVWLTYWREDESGHCYRKAEYQILSALDGFDGDWIYQKITWVDPANQFTCSRDVDMRPGYESWTPILRIENELRLKLPLGDNNLIYRFYLSADPASRRDGSDSDFGVSPF